MARYLDGRFFLGRVFGKMPNTAGGTPALPIRLSVTPYDA